MIDVKQAIKAAKESLSGLYQDFEVKDLLLEEVELTEDEKFWNITLGFSVPRMGTEPQLYQQYARQDPILFPTKYERQYKLFKIDTTSGQMKSMTIRTV